MNNNEQSSVFEELPDEVLDNACKDEERKETINKGRSEKLADYEMEYATLLNDKHVLKFCVSNDAPVKQFTKAHKDDAGYDLRALEGGTLEPGEQMTVRTGLYLRLPPGHVGLVKSRSGLAVRHGIEVGAGVIDEGYTGEVHVLLRNFGDAPFTFDKGMRIAQMLVMPIYTGGDVSVMRIEYLGRSKRGNRGFGSTGEN